MIITDLDETLLRSDKTISSYTLNVLSKCKEKGIKIVFATARSIIAATRFLDLYMPDIVVILMTMTELLNGCKLMF
jgi:hydroxymethylpyrimidine pyrophosphatase-like HAD family hydrolase